MKDLHFGLVNGLKNGFLIHIFLLCSVIIVSVAALAIGAPIHDVATSFGNGFWSLIPFTLQMTMLIIVGYVVSVSKPVKFLIKKWHVFQILVVVLLF